MLYLTQWKLNQSFTMKRNFFYLLMMSLVCFAIQPATAKTTLSQSAEDDANIFGHVVDAETGEHLPYVAVAVKGTTHGTLTDATGHFMLKGLPLGEFDIVVSSVGYKESVQTATIKKNTAIELNFSLLESMIALDDVVVSSTRSETKRRLAPTLVKVIDSKLFETINAPTLSGGLGFQPGVRVENNCQNCGFTQVRINGMEGKYTQILVDSRPIFSSLAGVYGLEQIPANMIDRVEVVRGGGSALFGSSAIAGTINIITKEPLRNSASFSHNISNLDGSGSFENNTMLNASLVSDNNKAGVTLFGQNRERGEWDANGDGFSEVPELRNQSIGLNAYLRTSDYSKLNVEYHHMNEFRRGGSSQGLPPHIAEDAEVNGTGEDGLVEQLEHSINTGSIKFNAFSADQKHNISLYASAQNILRDSYYSAYGQTKNFTAVGGAQYIYNFDKFIFMPASLTGGVEYNYDNLQDRATDFDKYRTYAKEDPSYDGKNLDALIKKYTPAPLDQKVGIFSAYAQNEWKNEMWSILIGARLDKHSMIEKAIISPRANLRFNPTEDINIRVSYAEGFRAPQAFDEDLHISQVGGEMISIELDPNLKEERSRSFNASVDWYTMMGDNWQLNLLVEGFYNRLTDAFVLSTPEDDPSGHGLVQTRSNGPGATVSGATLEGKLAYQDKFQLQMGYTLQSSKYDEAVEWGSADGQSSKDFMRTPDNYGYFTASYTPSKAWMFSLNGNYTGRMYVPHLWSEVNGGVDELVYSQSFFELGAKIAYNLRLAKAIDMQINLGVQNLFNSYQSDFDKGAGRDSGYLYGPSLPRTFFAGVKFDI